MTIPGIYKLLTISDVPDEVLNNPVWKSSFPSTTHPDRLKGIILSRYILSLCLKEKGISLSPYEIEIHEGKWNLPFFVSLSHTSTFAIGIICEKNEVNSIGVDIELQQRSISFEAQKRILPQSLSPNIPILKIWTSLEAAFKAMPKDLSKQTHPLELFIDEKYFFNPKKEVCGELLHLPHPDLQITFAYSLKDFSVKARSLI